MPVAWRPARFLCGSFSKPPPVRHRSSAPALAGAYAAHCARLVVAERRRDRDDPRILRRAHRQASKRTPEPWTTEPTSRTASPPPTGSGDHGGSLGGREGQDYKHGTKTWSRTSPRHSGSREAAIRDRHPLRRRGSSRPIFDTSPEVCAANGWSGRSRGSKRRWTVSCAPKRGSEPARLATIYIDLARRRRRRHACWVHSRRRAPEPAARGRKETVMSQREEVIEREAARSAGTGDMKLEVVVIPVSDVERAKRFYGSLGWRVDADFVTGDAFRVVQFTPPGSPCSITSARASRRPCRARRRASISSCRTSRQRAPSSSAAV